MAHLCCMWLDLRRGTVAIGVFYVCYLLLVTLTLAVLAGVLAVGWLWLAAGGTLLLAALAGLLLLGAVRRRRALLLLWLITYGAVLLTLTVGVFGLAVAAETGQRTFLTEFCQSRPTRRCSFRLFHYSLLLFAVEWYWWAVVVMRYRQLGQETLAQHADPPPPGVQVRAAHNGEMQHVPVTYYDDTGRFKQPTAAGEAGGVHYGAGYGEGAASADTGRHLAVMSGF